MPQIHRAIIFDQLLMVTHPRDRNDRFKWDAQRGSTQPRLATRKLAHRCSENLGVSGIVGGQSAATPRIRSKASCLNVPATD